MTESLSSQAFFSPLTKHFCTSNLFSSQLGTQRFAHKKGEKSRNRVVKIQVAGKNSSTLSSHHKMCVRALKSPSSLLGGLSLCPADLYKLGFRVA